MGRTRRRANGPIEGRPLQRDLGGPYEAGPRCIITTHNTEPRLLDFYCPSRKLAIGLDGKSHDSPEDQRYDAERDRFLASQGIRVVRFPNVDVLRSPLAVAEAILDYLRRP